MMQGHAQLGRLLDLAEGVRAVGRDASLQGFNVHGLGTFLPVHVCYPTMLP